MPARQTPAAARFRVAIADDDAAVREALSSLLDGDPRLEVCGAFADGDELLTTCRRDTVDVAVIDVVMPGGGPPLARAIHDLSPATVVVVHTARRNRATRSAMLDAGAAAFVTKGGPTDVMAVVLALLPDPRRAPPAEDG